MENEPKKEQSEKSIVILSASLTPDSAIESWGRANMPTNGEVQGVLELVRFHTFMHNDVEVPAEHVLAVLQQRLTPVKPEAPVEQRRQVAKRSVAGYAFEYRIDEVDPTNLQPLPIHRTIAMDGVTPVLILGAPDGAVQLGAYPALSAADVVKFGLPIVRYLETILYGLRVKEHSGEGKFISQIPREVFDSIPLQTLKTRISRVNVVTLARDNFDETQGPLPGAQVDNLVQALNMPTISHAGYYTREFGQTLQTGVLLALGCYTTPQAARAWYTARGVQLKPIQQFDEWSADGLVRTRVVADIMTLPNQNAVAPSYIYRELLRRNRDYAQSVYVAPVFTPRAEPIVVLPKSSSKLTRSAIELAGAPDGGLRFAIQMADSYANGWGVLYRITIDHTLGRLIGAMVALMCLPWTRIVNFADVVSTLYSHIAQISLTQAQQMAARRGVLPVLAAGGPGAPSLSVLLQAIYQYQVGNAVVPFPQLAAHGYVRANFRLPRAYVQAITAVNGNVNPADYYGSPTVGVGLALATMVQGGAAFVALAQRIVTLVVTAKVGRNEQIPVVFDTLQVAVSEVYRQSTISYVSGSMPRDNELIFDEIVLDALDGWSFLSYGVAVEREDHAFYAIYQPPRAVQSREHAVRALRRGQLCDLAAAAHLLADGLLRLNKPVKRLMLRRDLAMKILERVVKINDASLVTDTFDLIDRGFAGAYANGQSTIDALNYICVHSRPLANAGISRFRSAALVVPQRPKLGAAQEYFLTSEPAGPLTVPLNVIATAGVSNTRDYVELLAHYAPPAAGNAAGQNFRKGEFDSAITGVRLPIADGCSVAFVIGENGTQEHVDFDIVPSSTGGLKAEVDHITVYINKTHIVPRASRVLPEGLTAPFEFEFVLNNGRYELRQRGAAQLVPGWNATFAPVRDATEAANLVVNNAINLPVTVTQRAMRAPSFKFEKLVLSLENADVTAIHLT